MCSNLLPDWVNLFLNEVETFLCFVILIVMIMCTVQLIVSQSFDIGCTVYQNVTDGVETSGGTEFKSKDIIGRIKEMLLGWYSGKSNQEKMKKSGKNACPKNSQEEEWDYCEGDVD